jgi:hypothetical protein
MKRTLVRLLLVLAALGCAAGAGFYAYRLEPAASAAGAADRTFAEDVIRLQATLAEIRAGQAAYVATGQDTAAWIGKVSQLRAQADAQLKRLGAVASSSAVEGDTNLATVAEALAALGRFDARILEVLRDEQPLTASGLIFSDSAQISSAATATLSKARAAHAQTAATVLADVRRQQLIACAAAGAVLLLTLILLAATPGRSRSEDDDEDAEGGAVPTSPSLFGPPPAPEPFDLDLDDDASESERRMRAPWRSEAAPASPAPTPAVTPPAPAAVQARGSAPTPAVSTRLEARGEAVVPARLDLAAAAQLCTDLARVRDASEMQALLARAAELLDANGIVVWMGGAGADVLWPAFSHGYSPQALGKMQALPRDGGTPVSVAFRKGMMEVVPAASGATSGALVVPILTASGCVGVMAVEIRHGAEGSDAEQALASILAAQLATLVAGEAS